VHGSCLFDTGTGVVPDVVSDPAAVAYATTLPFASTCAVRITLANLKGGTGSRRLGRITDSGDGFGFGA
jgi:CO dehydrogenase/acetyl-CoA synthase delta subunit